MKILLTPKTEGVVESVSLLFNIEPDSSTYFGCGVGVLALNPMRQTLEVFYHPMSVISNMRSAGILVDSEEIVPTWAESFKQNITEWERHIQYTPLVSISQWECIVWKGSYAEKYIETVAPSLFLESDLMRGL